ncbi:hypothetical protein Plhal703r1_c12g0063601 [Plasmopara halstedii]
MCDHSCLRRSLTICITHLLTENDIYCDMYTPNLLFALGCAPDYCFILALAQFIRSLKLKDSQTGFQRQEVLR